MYSIAFRPDDRTLAVGGYTGEVALWDVADHKRIATLGEGCTAESIVLSPDGKILAVGDYCNNVTLWDVATGSKSATLPEGSDVSTVAFSPDGRRLGDVNGNLGLWNVVNRQPIAAINEGGQVTSLAFSPDGRSLAVGDADSVVGILPVSLWGNLASLSRLLCNEVQSNMTVTQRNANISDQPYQKTCPTYPAGY